MKFISPKEATKQFMPSTELLPFWKGTNSSSTVAVLYYSYECIMEEKGFQEQEWVGGGRGHDQRPLKF